MPQLNPSPWLLIFLMTWAVLLTLLNKTTKYEYPNTTSTKTKKTKTPLMSWNWPWW